MGDNSGWKLIQQQAQADILSYMALMRPGSIFGRHHFFFRDVINALQSREKRFICLSCPPRHSKSYTFSQALPAWWLGNNPSDQIIAASYSADLARAFGAKVREDMGSQMYSRIFSPLSQPLGKSLSGRDFILKGGGKYKSSGVRGSITGFGGDLIIVDDPIKDAVQADSKKYRTQLEKFFGEVLYTRLMPGGRIVVMMTRWRDDDLISYILRNFSSDGWEYINIPALVEPQDIQENTPGNLGRELDQWLWPEFFTQDDYIKFRKVLGESAFQAMYQGRPVSAEGGTLKSGDLRWVDQLPDAIAYKFWSWDTALTENQKSDYTVGQLWTVHKSGKCHLSDYRRFQGNFTTVESEILDCYDSSMANFVVLEHSHMGLSLRDQIAKDRPGIKVELIKPVGTKLSRLQACLPMWRDDQVYIRRLAERQDFDDCIDELVKAGLTQHDDFMDALTQALTFVKSQPRVTSDRHKILTLPRQTTSKLKTWNVY